MEKFINNNIKYETIKRPSDKILLTCVLSLCLIGIMAVISASTPMCIAKHISMFHFICKHLMWLAMGLVGLVFFRKFDYKNLKKYTFTLPIIVIVLLLLIKYTPLGVEINGARRWLNLGLFQFQPSELSKLAVIMLLSSLFSLKEKVFKRKIVFYVVMMFAMLGVILMQPNLSMVIILLGISGIIYFCAGKSLKPLFVCFLLFVGLIVMVQTDIVDIHKILKPYQIERIKNLLHPNNDLQGGGYQVHHSMIAIASGGIVGQGYGCSKEKHGWLPEAHTDFIFSVLSEEMGFVGDLFIILLFLTIFYRGVNISVKSPDMYGKMLSIGITSSIIMQTFFNIAVVTSFLPATGITLPFVSYGGSSLFVSLCMIGILLNISKTQRRKVRMINQEV